MSRRTFLLSAGTVVSTLVTGCLGSSGAAENDNTETRTIQSPGSSTPNKQQPYFAEFDRCPRLVVSIVRLPEPARQEVETALETGSYETNSELSLPHVIDTTRSYLERDETYYQAKVSDSDATERLELIEATPTKGQYPITVENHDGQITVDIVITYLKEDTRLLTESHSLAPDDQVTTGDIDRKLGEYQATVDTSQFSKTLTWREEEHKDPLETIIVTDDDAYYRPRPVAEPVQCEDFW